jgi:hypothetical protein
MQVKDAPQRRLSSLLQDFLKKIGCCNLLLECFVAVYLHEYDWKKDLNPYDICQLREQMLQLIRSTAPNIVILDLESDADVYHPSVKGSIVIPEFLAVRWDRVMVFEPESRLALVIEAILKGIIVHQLAHWLADLDGSLSLLESYSLLSLDDTAKPARVELKERGRQVDPGDYVEKTAGGGIPGYEVERDDGAPLFCPSFDAPLIALILLTISRFPDRWWQLLVTVYRISRISSGKWVYVL